MNLKLEQLRVFVAVAESGSITDAAVQIGRTASALSMTLRQIENQLDGKLFDGERKSRLTPLGSFTLKQAKIAVESHRLAVQDIQRFSRGEGGFTRIAVVPSVATRVLPRAIHHLRQQFPRLKADIRDIDSHAIHVAILEGQVDFGIASLPGDDSLDAEFLLEDDYRLICRQDHPLNRLNRPIRWDDIDASEFIVNGLCEGIVDPGMQTVVDASSLYMHNTQTILAFVESGYGITILPELAQSNNRNISTLQIDKLEMKRTLYTLKRRSVSLSPIDEHLIAAVRKSVTELGMSPNPDHLSSYEK